MTNLIHADLTYTLRGVMFDVYNQLGPALPEKVYQQAMSIGLEKQGLSHQRERSFEVYYRNQRVGFYLTDIWLKGGQVIVELKVAPEILPIHQAQTISYLKVTDADLALIANFGAASMQIERLPNFVRHKTVDLHWTPQTLPDSALYPELTDKLLQSLHQVQLALGAGFLHQIYRRATMIELQYQGIKFEYIKTMPLTYQGQQIGLQEVRLIAVEGKILVATIAVKQLNQTMRQALQARLRHLDFQLGILANFNTPRLEFIMVRI